MTLSIRTTSTSHETMEVTPIVLRETQTTRLSFYPSWVDVSDNPLRGGFKFERKGVNDTWDEFDSKPLSATHKDEEYALNLNGTEIKRLLEEWDKINSVLSKHGHSFGEREFVLHEINIDGVFVQIGDIDNRELVVTKLKELEAHNFESLGTAIGSARLDKIITEFAENIQNDDESFWQNFFESNPWILQQVFAFPVIYLNGETYLGGKNSSGRQGNGGTATDFLCKNGSNGSFGVIEIKTPKTDIVGANYRGVSASGDNNELNSMHADLTGGIVQMENQIHTAVDYFTLQLGRDYPDTNILNPSGVLIIGNYSALSDVKQKSFDLFRKSLGKNQVLTFDEVLEKLKLLQPLYEN